MSSGTTMIGLLDPDVGNAFSSWRVAARRNGVRQGRSLRKTTRRCAGQLWRLGCHRTSAAISFSRWSSTPVALRPLSVRRCGCSRMSLAATLGDPSRFGLPVS